MKNDIHIECTITATSDRLASRIFKLAANRLLDVNTWSELEGSLISKCTLMDENGHLVDRNVHQNDYLQIQRPSEQAANQGKWIKVERVEEIKSNEGMESITVLTHASPDPRGTGITNAVRNAEVKRGAFKIVKDGLHVTAGVYAESDPEVEAANIGDRMRNLSLSAYATLGAYCVQW
ncbi:MAG TPA: hypothetical protein VK666_17545, partial [Chryseolinea sp.]|nr:hypothetical protein [Chryseolinea sp.]